MERASLSPSDFLRSSRAVLEQIEQGILDAEIDADASFVSEGVLEIEFEDGGKMIINRHDVSQEIWVAGRTGAHHFFWTGQEWMDTRSNEQLLAVVSHLATQMAGAPVSLS